MPVRLLIVISALVASSCARVGFQERASEVADLGPTLDQSQDLVDAQDGNPPVDLAHADTAVQPDSKPWPDTTPWPDTSGPVCPGTMADFGAFCIDKDDSSSLTWVRAAEHCMSKGKRLCSDSEWLTACQSSGKGMIDMTGTYEWIAQLASDTSGKKRGSSTCASASSHSVTSGVYQTRCCQTPSPSTSGMADFTTFHIDKDDSASLTWVRTVEHCMSKGKRLCSTAEWLNACQSTGKGMVDMTGTYEWISELASDTSGKKRGSSTCASASSHGVTAGAYQTRCCVD
jgi:hypothetical protein